uniref:Uncharacterized protein n=1 Tax=Mesocestoides corti TaxID=53468 RepID=A0A5K3FKZ8_MESCO
MHGWMNGCVGIRVYSCPIPQSSQVPIHLAPISYVTPCGEILQQIDELRGPPGTDERLGERMQHAEKAKLHEVGASVVSSSQLKGIRRPYLLCLILAWRRLLVLHLGH